MAGKRVLSVELGVQTSRICELDISGKKQTVINSCTFDTPEGAIEDGYIRNKDILAISMKSAIQKYGMHAKNVAFSISSSKIANREVNMPKMPDNKIQTFVQTNAKEYFPIEVEQYVITYKKLEEIKEDDTTKLRILVLAAPNDLIETYYEMTKVLQLDIVGIDYTGNSSYQVLKRQNMKDVNVFIQLNENNTLINILNNGTLILQRTVPYGVNAIVDAAINCGEFDIVDKGTAYEKLFTDTLINPKLNESAIDDVALSYMDSNNDAYSQQIRQMKAKDEITDAISYLINNSIRVLDYYASKYPDKKVHNIYIIGLGSRIKGIVPLFRNEVYSEIMKLENIVGIDFAKSCSLANEDKSEYMSCLGAMIDAVDFVPKQHAEAAKQKQQSHYFKLIVLGMLVLSGVLLAVPALNMSSKKMKRDSLQKEIEDKKDVQDIIDAAKEADSKYTNAVNIYSKTTSFSYLFNVLLEELEKALPKGSTIGGFSYGENNLSLSITAKSVEEVGQFIINARKCPLIENVEVNAYSGSANKGVGEYSYSMNVTLVDFDYSVFMDKSNLPTEETVRRILGIPDENANDKSEKTEDTDDNDANADNESEENN